MPDHSPYARRLREIADALDAEPHSTDDALTPHPDTLEVVSNRHTKRGQLNYAVPEVLQLQRRIRRYNADTDVPHGDIVALALDTWLRAKGYPPDLRPPETEAI
ncbi:hypothetical protein Stsp02_63480 [Streptomyces sp. NBRC 14336]|uniref:hypothetical protein n=1 Tax=unclassified Streptomyces TaxID=2593676 RepID=UPI000671E0C5|nr:MULTISPECIES: hypothetical protein [unclassified Streptomyces]KMS88620.1 hypothetical protein ACZ91_24840 [Streptomyces regensis]OXS31007.1 hypothetical protein CHR28_33330 [Streptomyces sp. XY006]GHK02052.1 hypothetical protein SY2F82_38490 [Streptomyces sp. Y2F8-2]GLW50687.1 hypothetical protein Stsp02_63480 [Streptomyces sp. NBRC 14336]